MFKNIQKKKTALNLFRNPPSRTVLIWLLTDSLELLLSKSILSLISLVYFSVLLCPGQFFQPNFWLVKVIFEEYLHFSTTNPQFLFNLFFCPSMLLCSRQYFQPHLWLATGYLRDLLALLYPNPSVFLKSFCCLFLLLCKRQFLHTRFV